MATPARNLLQHLAQASANRAYAALTSEDDGRVCRDIPESACRHQPSHFLLHLVCLAATKTGDGLSDPKLVLSWLLGALGAPAAMIGLLVPIREAGALLPQLVIAARIRQLALRKWVWVVGSLIQGLCVLGMAAVAVGLEGVAAGAAVLGLLSVFAVARSLCSISYKDVLGKTVSKATRGTVTGSAATVAAAGVLLAAVALSLDWLPTEPSVVALLLLVAALLWLFAAAMFANLNEEPGATEGGGNPLQLGWQQLGLLRRDEPLRRFIACRSLLLATALAPPFMLGLAGQSADVALGQLGPLLLAAALAALSSSYLWGRLADRSSRRVLRAGGALAALALGSVVALAWISPERLAGNWLMPALLYTVLVAHQAVRLGRTIHLVDMADPRLRASYTALSNSIIGIVLLLSGGLAWLAQAAGYTVVLATLAGCSLAGAIAASGLREVQQTPV